MRPESVMKILFVHGALVRDGGWWWSRMVEPLKQHGLETSAVELPSCDGKLSDDLYADTDAVRAAIREADDAVILLGHSYGATVITDAAAGEQAVEHLVYLTAMIPDTGDSLASIASGPAPWVRVTEDGYVELLTDQLDALFLQDCDQEAKDGAHHRIARQSALAFSQPVRAAAWRSIPSTYIVCAEDLAIPQETQRLMAQKTSAIIELSTGHHPFLSNPSALAEALATIARCPRGRRAGRVHF
jgi:pimeloyl-ACP methyl ester carboxylesterase